VQVDPTASWIEQEYELNLQDLRFRLREFADARDWNQFHSPKNLAMALSVEVAELVEPFQWLTEEASHDLPDATKTKAAEEIADVQIYLVRLADKLGIDILESVEAKLQKNEAKYPASRVKGSSRKYSDYDATE
jgi:NTP pyrophosphatase (non-canonical NTP hydrolase)